jgi:hypothetical protein
MVTIYDTSMTLRKLLLACVAENFGIYFAENVVLPNALHHLCADLFVKGIDPYTLRSKIIREYMKHFQNGGRLGLDEPVPDEYNELISEISEEFCDIKER